MLRTTALILLIALAAVSGPRCAVAQPAAGTAEINGWIVQLDANDYQTRKAAMESLAEAGGDVISPLLMAILSSDSQELRIRGTKVLQALAQSDETRTIARDALRQVIEQSARGTVSDAQRILDDLDALEEVKALKELHAKGANIERRPIQINAFGRPAQSTGVRVRIDHRWKGTAEDFRYVSKVKSLEVLFLQGDNITDRYLPHVAGLPNLKAIVVLRTKVTEVGIGGLKDLPALVSLAIWYSPVGDAAAKTLTNLKTIHSFSLYGLPMSQETGNNMIAAMPGKMVDFRRGGFLGVAQSVTNQDRCILGTVEPGSAAEKAGLRMNDEVLSYRGVPLEGFIQLKDLIAEDSAGKTVEVKLIRGGKKLTKQVTLGEWIWDERHL